MASRRARRDHHPRTATTSYGYDPKGQLTAVTNGLLTRRFKYDANGNRLEAIFWHGGGDILPVEKFKALIKADRDTLLAFLGSLSVAASLLLRAGRRGLLGARRGSLP